MLAPTVHPSARCVPPTRPNSGDAPPHEPPPTLDDHRNAIPANVLCNLFDVITDSKLRHEATTYGYYASFLTAVFPIRRWFQVSIRFISFWCYTIKSNVDAKVDPQYPIRPRARHSLHVSPGSDGEDHDGSVPGSQSDRANLAGFSDCFQGEPGVEYPDFVVSKVIPTDGPPRSKHYLAVLSEPLP